MILASLTDEVRTEAQRRQVQRFTLVLFGTIFLILVAGETLFATMIFSIIQIEIMGVIFSGAAFAMLVPTVIGYAHVRLHHEGDLFLAWWLRKLSGIGILVFALGVSLMVGFSAWQAAQDAVSVIATSPIGTMGGTTVGSDIGGSSGVAEWIAFLPNSLLFLGLSFGMLITISFASFCLGRALQAFNFLTHTPRIGREVKERIEAATARIAAFRKLRDRDAAARRKLPFDIKSKFAREAAYTGWKVMQTKLAAARRRFDPMTRNDPLASILRDAEANSISARFKTEDEFARHLADQMDSLRMHNLLRVLTGIPETGKDQL